MNRAELDALKERAQDYVTKSGRFAELRAPIEDLLSRFDGLGSISKRTLATIMPTLSERLEELRAAIED